MAEKFRTSIHSPLKKRTLFEGSIFAGIGVLILVLSGIFLPLSQLDVWGFLVFAFGLGLIAYGLIPYRKLTALENCPDELVIDKSTLTYFSRKKPIFTVACSDISSVEYRDDSERYGIIIILNETKKTKIIIHDYHTAKKIFKNSPLLFFPYFSKRAFEQISQVL